MNQFKQWLLLCSILLLSTKICWGQTASNLDSNQIKKEMAKAAKHMRKAFIQKDYETFFKYIHPKVYALLGDPKLLQNAMIQEIDKMAADGFVFKSVYTGDPIHLVQVDKELQCVVPEILEINTGNATLKVKSYLIALSEDMGQTWYFVDTNNKPLSYVKKVFPTLSNELILPEKEAPEIVK